MSADGIAKGFELAHAQPQGVIKVMFNL
jgi:hypothetical protein